MTRKGKERFEPRLILRLAVDVLTQLGRTSGDRTRPTDWSCAFRPGVHVAQYTVVARGEEVGVHVREVLVAAIKEFRIVRPHRGVRRQWRGVRATWRASSSHLRREKRDSPRSADRAAVGAETVGVTLGEEDAFARHAVEVGRHFRVAFRAPTTLPPQLSMRMSRMFGRRLLSRLSSGEMRLSVL